MQSQPLVQYTSICIMIPTMNVYFWIEISYTTYTSNMSGHAYQVSVTNGSQEVSNAGMQFSVNGLGLV